MKITQSSGSSTPANRAPQASQPDVLAYETSQDQVILYGGDGRPMPGSDKLKSKGDSFMRNLLLPSKMPDSVSADYVPSRRWNFTMELAGSVQSYLGTAAALNAVGIGNGPLTVGLAWMVRDAIDGIGKFAGSQFGRQADKDPKGWVTTGEYVHAVGSMMESTLAVAPGAFLAIAPAANAVKAFGTTVKSAAQAPIELHQARDNNLGEMRSKNNNQNMLASIIGAGLGFGLEKLGSHYIGSAATPVLMAAATAGKLFATHGYVKSLDLDPVTEKRISKHVHKWLDVGKADKAELKKLKLGAPLSDFVKDPARFRQLTEMYGPRNYMLDVQQDKIAVVLHQDSTPEDQLQAVTQASLIRILQGSPLYQVKIGQEGAAAKDWLLRTSLGAVPDVVASFARDEDDPLRFTSDARRAHWDKSPGENIAHVSKADFQKLTQTVKG
ncbi:MAG: RUS1 family protein [Candidatus Eremiobacteraeota bacterium]|nr:RUS1 family protein [Candidatus Eremiobacteraeota bacterium]MCW5869127.1 RUS1 family protein [Candidatus Eremiobacteraeota bacterium]